MSKNKIIILIVMVIALISAISVVIFYKKEYVVKFDSDGGTSINEQIVKKDELAIEPKEPVKEEYTFLYWELEDKEYLFNTKVIKDITLTAKYEKEKDIVYTVTFNSDGGSLVKEQTIKKGEKVIKPNNPTKAGYKFIHWQLNGNEYLFNSELTKDIILVSKWEIMKLGDTGGLVKPIKPSFELEPKIDIQFIKNTVTFDSAGGSPVAPVVVIFSGKVEKPKNPTKNGYKFVEWRLKDTLYNFDSKVTEDITLLAKWKKKFFWE